MRNDPVGLFVIGAWLEGGSSRPLRMEIRATTDVSAGFQQHLTYVDLDGACDALRAWLADILTNPREGGTAASD